MTRAQPIPVNVITGALGSGKTTLLARLLGDPGMADTAVLINEFGEVGLDHHLLQRIDADTVAYEFTVNDAPTWTRPWTVAFPLSRMQDEIYEYACHEGNYSIAGVLGGARADEARADGR